MIYNPFLEQLMRVVGITELTMMQERELQDLIKSYISNVSDRDSASYAEGYDAGYEEASDEHEDDYDDGKTDGANEFKDYILTHLQRQECEDISEDLIKKFSDYIEDLWISY